MELTETKAISLEVLNERETSLIALAATAKELTIAGIEDKEGYKLVREKRIELKNERVSIQNDAYDLRENALKFQKTVIKREKQLVAIIAGEESRLSSLEDDYDRQVEEVRKQKEREENARIQARVDALAKFNHAIDHYDAKVMPEENFQALLGEAETAYIKDQERIASEKAEEERRKAEALEAQRLYEERLRKEREELDRQKAEYEAQRKADLELAEKAHKEREYLEEQSRKEQQRKEAELRAEREKLEAEKRAIELEKAKQEAAEKARIEEQNRIKREAEAKEQRELRAKEEAARQESLKPDKEKLLTFAEGLPGIPCPEIKDIAAANILDVAFDKIEAIRDFIKKEIEKL
jgi:hypothetical protein